MPRRRKDEQRILGPYDDGDGARLIVIDPRAVDPRVRRIARTFESRAKAEAFKRITEARWSRLSEVTVRQGIDSYKAHLERKGNKSGSIDQTIYRLGLFFSAPERLIADVTHTEAVFLYDALTERRKPNGELISVDYHRNTLAEARSFMKWCVSKQWARSNPLDGVEGVGRRKRGKAQLTANEARKWWETARFRINRGDVGALAAAMTLLMGPRATEITKRIVRDVDDGGALLRISDAKTEAGNRILAVPSELREPLLKLCEGRNALAYLFAQENGEPHLRGWPRGNVRRICKLAGVPLVSAHGMRGTHATIARAIGETGHAVQGALGQESIRTGEAHYSTPESVSVARQERALQVINGGRR
jgi:integrase